MAIIYLSGPMTGYPDYNYPAFNLAAAALRAYGHRVYNPAFAAFSAFICLEADTIVALPGWEKSRGATAEMALAHVCGLEVYCV